MTRIETGIVQFDNDWPGVFIRGDNAFGFAQALRAALRALPQESETFSVDVMLARNGVAALADLLEASNMSDHKYVRSDVQVVTRIDK